MAATCQIHRCMQDIQNQSKSPSRIVPTWPADVCRMTVLHNPHMEPIVRHVWWRKVHSITWFHVKLIWYHPMVFATCISTSVPLWHLRCEWCAVAVPLPTCYGWHHTASLCFTLQQPGTMVCWEELRSQQLLSRYLKILQNRHISPSICVSSSRREVWDIWDALLCGCWHHMPGIVNTPNS